MVKHSGIAADIVAVVGFEKATRLFAHYGGKQLKIPFGTGRAGAFTEHLLKLLGEDGYKAMAARFGGESMTMPKGKAAALIARNRQIVADYDSGTPMLSLVLRYDLTERQIRTILGRPIE